MDEPSWYKYFYKGRLPAQKMYNFYEQILKVYLCLIVYFYPGVLVDMHWQETFYTPTPASTQAKCCNIIRDKVVQVKKALDLPLSAQRLSHYISIRSGNPHLLMRH